MLNNIWSKKVFKQFQEDFSEHLLRSVDTYITSLYYNPETDRYLTYSKKKGYPESSTHIVKVKNTGEKYTVIEATRQDDIVLGFTVVIGTFVLGSQNFLGKVFVLEDEYNG